MFDTIVTHLVRRGLRGVWVAGDSARDPAHGPGCGPAVWAANHHSWWDPFVLTALSDRPAVLMRQDNLDKFRFARAIGAFGTREPRRGLDHLRQGRQMIIFPEGELCSPGPLRELAGGAAWFAAKAQAPLLAVALRVRLRGHQAPEAYVWFDEIAVHGSSADTTRRLTARLTQTLSEVDARIEAAEPRSAVPGFTLAIPGRRSPDERIEAWTRRLRWQR
jgi:1-acyl-sn-glycerol-3-phosphate acyltransferase